MDLKVYEIEKFEQIPDIHGALYDAIEEFKPVSHLRLENDIKSFLNYIDPEKVEKNPPISATMLIAPWGLGKTTSYDITIKNLLESEDYNGISIKLRAQDISNYYDTFSNSKYYKSIAGNADRYLFILSKLILNDINSKQYISNETKSLEGLELVSKTLDDLQKKYKFFIIFVDELEEVVKSKNDIIPFILKSTKDLLNGSSKIINNKSNRNFLSFILACTDSAFYEVSRLEELEYQFGGIKRRIPEITISDISLSECIEYLVKLNKYCYKGKFVKSFLNPGASFNTIARMAMKNPGHMKSIFTILMNKSATLNPGSLMYQIDGKLILENCQNYKLEYMETQRKSIAEEIYSNWFRKFVNNPLILGIINILIGEIQPFTIQDIINRFDTKLSENEILDSINKFNEYIRSIHSNVGDAILQVNRFKEGFTSADLQNILTKCGYKIETSDDFKTNINFKVDGMVNLEDFLDTLSYFHIEDDANVKRNHFFVTDTEILRQQLFPYLSNTTVNTLKNEFKKHLDTKNDFFILNPVLFNIIFPLPIPKEYNLLDDKNDNLRLWTNISRKRKSEIYRKDICDIISNFFITNEILKKSSIRELKSEKITIDKFQYFADIRDKNQFLILNNFVLNDVSQYPISIMFWREIGDYSNSIMNDIAHTIENYQKNENKNIHIIFLISQNKIPEELIMNLNITVEYTIVKEIPLSQFDITKFAFLNELYLDYQGKYDENKFNIASNQLKVPFNEIFTSVREDVNSKGLNIKLNSLTSNLSEIPQLMKHILYDFDNDFSKWNDVVLKKPFEKINPIGLSPRYSSSLDDWSEDKLKTSVSEYLLVNGFVEIGENNLKVSMPKIEIVTLNLLKFFSKYDISLTVNQLKDFFFDISRNPDLFKDIFITDLENRGLIEIKQKKVKLLEIDDVLLNQKYEEINRKVNQLRIKDHHFYHIFTIKQKGKNLIYLDDFFKVLDNLLKQENCMNGNIHFNYTRYILFLRIYEIFDEIINKIFIPMDVKISKLEKDLKKVSVEKLHADYIELKLKEYGLKDVTLSKFPEIQNYIENVDEIKNYFYQSVDKEKLKEDTEFYYKTHRKEVRLQGELFSYLKLQQNKLKDDFGEPFLNFLYFQIKENMKKFEEDPVIEEINKILRYLDEVDRKYKGIYSQITKVSISDENSLAFKILNSISKLSKFEFDEKQEKVESLKEIESFLKGIIKQVEDINVPISRILKRASIGPPKSLIDKIYEEEQEIERLENLFTQRCLFCIEQNVCEKLNELKKMHEPFKKFDKLSYIPKIDKCKSLVELADQSDQVERDMSFEISKLEGKLLKINNLVYEFFLNYKDLESLTKIFESFNMRGYAKQCESYERSIGRLNEKSYDIDFNGIINHLLSLRAKIDEGHNKILESELPEPSQKLYQALYEKYGNKGSFSEKDLISVSEKVNLTIQNINKALEDLYKKKLIEKRYSFIS